jgi:hypothetical protein
VLLLLLLLLVKHILLQSWAAGSARVCGLEPVWSCRNFLLLLPGPETHILTESDFRVGAAEAAASEDQLSSRAILLPMRSTPILQLGWVQVQGWVPEWEVGDHRTKSFMNPESFILIIRSLRMR